MGRVLMHIILSIGLGFIMQLILHELGHLFGGLITGWRFLYLQIHRLIIKRENKRIRLMIIGERGYKCIMYPKSVGQGAKLYTMGGCVINLLSSAAVFLIFIFVSMSPVMWLYIWSFTCFGLGLFLMNGIASTKRICNDRACYNLLKADRCNILCHNAQLITARHLMNGLTYGEIGEELICLCPKIADNDICAYQTVLEYYYYLDIKNYLKMGQALNKIRTKDNISKYILDIVESELFYVRILCAIIIKAKRTGLNRNDVSDEVNKVNTGDSFIKRDRDLYIRDKRITDIHSQRIKAVYGAYRHFVVGDMDKAVDTLNESIKLLNDSLSVYLGEKKFCIRRLVEVRKIIEAIYISV
ncbi:MAG: hypothetical protein PHC56_07255 [Herbinix sp.]|nr:hypothetical protein [Herbinix sp.]